MPEDIDNSNLCFGVHYDKPVEEAQEQFRIWGFNGIRSFTKERAMQGNDARRVVIAEAKKENAKWFFIGNYDASIGNDAAVYRFRFTSYTGDLQDGTGDWKFYAGWSGR